MLFLVYFTKYKSQQVEKWKQANQQKSALSPGDCFEGQIERILLLQIMYFVHGMFLFVDMLILSLQTHDYFQDRYFVF